MPYEKHFFLDVVALLSSDVCAAPPLVSHLTKCQGDRSPAKAKFGSVSKRSWSSQTGS